MLYNSSIRTMDFTLFTRISLLLLTLVFFTTCKIPDYIQVCQRNDPKLSSCINNSISALIPYLIKGIPELDVPPLEPLTLDNIELRTGGRESAQIGANLSDLVVWGASGFRIIELKPNLEKNTFRFKVALPRLHLDGTYSTDTRVLFLNLQGSGAINVNITDYTFDCILKGHKIIQNGDEYLQFDKMKLRIHLGPTTIRLENLFNGNPILGRATNDAINDNSDIFLSEITPAIQNGLANKFTNIANQVTKRFTYKELFP